jgi:hypothetical protein
MPDHFSTIGVTFLDRKIRQLLREKDLAEQIVDPGKNGLTVLPFFLCFVKVNVTGGRQHVVAREQMDIVRNHRPEFAGKCFKDHTEDREDIRTATTDQLPVFLRTPGSQNDGFYRQIAEEFRSSFPQP